MEPVITHFKEYYIVYLGSAAAILPLLYVTRKWSVPFIQYILEISIYVVVMHTLMAGIVRLAVWFKDQTSMKRAFSDVGERPDWYTPFFQFWEKDLYIPQWIFWLEIVLVLGIFYAVWRFRPLRFQHKKRERKFSNEGGPRNTQANRLKARAGAAQAGKTKSWRGGRHGSR